MNLIKISSSDLPLYGTLVFDFFSLLFIRATNNSEMRIKLAESIRTEKIQFPKPLTYSRTE